MAALMFFPMLQNALGARFSYNINSEDAASRFMASHLLYNNITLLPRPDLWRSSFAILIGTNPLVAKGSLVSEPRFKEALDSIIERGGRVIVIDPRRTETARRYEDRKSTRLNSSH